MAPRILMPSLRAVDRQAFRGTGYEAQDVLAEVDDVDLVELEAGPGHALREHWVRRLAWRDVPGLFRRRNPGLKPVRLEADYDLFLLHCQHHKDLLYINAIKNWQRRCRKSICILEEVWAADVHRLRNYFRVLRDFDHVLVAFEGSVDAVSEAIGRPCGYLPMGIDTLRFTPFRDPLSRVIDVYSMGRRVEPIHRELLAMARRQAAFYVYDSLEGGGSSLMKDYRQHREMVAALAKRSATFLVMAARVDQPHETRGQVEIPNRYYEGSAAGAVLVGQRLDCDAFRRLFDWPDAVVEIQPDGTDVREVVQRLLADRPRLQRIGWRNAREALLRHDWAYRWQDVLSLAGLEPSPAMAQRLLRLRQLAATPELATSSAATLRA